MTHFGTIVAMSGTILGILVTILGFLIKGVSSFTRLVTKVESLESSSVKLTETLASVIVDVAVATHSDQSFEERLANLEKGGRRK